MTERTQNRITLLAMLTASLLSAFLLVLAVLLPKTEQSHTPKRQVNVSAGYEELLFDKSLVHTIDIRVADTAWSYMTEHAMEEQYVTCDLVIDGETLQGVGIRPKGNSSLKSISMQDSDRFSFKVEFDHYTAGKTYHGLDKLALNNLGQDVTQLKDYLTYTMMGEMGVAAPLCSYTLLLKNGEPFGLYLAVEAIEDSFVLRNYNTFDVQLYRPDVYSIELIKPEAFMKADMAQMVTFTPEPGSRTDYLGMGISLAFSQFADPVFISAGGYAGDNIDDYDVVFDSAVFSPDKEAKQRYINAVRTLNTSAAPEEGVDVESLAPYFAVHNFVNNYDSYTGAFVHNFYYCERDGRLSMIPWDYNLAFGAFSVESAMYSFFGGTDYEIDPGILGDVMRSEKSFVNYPIYEPTPEGQLEDRPLFTVLLDTEAGRTAYDEALRKLLSVYAGGGRFEQLAAEAAALIRPYMQQGLGFYSADLFEEALPELSDYGRLRFESMRGQLEGDIPGTLAGQTAAPETLVETGSLNMGKTIDFGGLAWGITKNDVVGVLDSIYGDMGITEESNAILVARIQKNKREIGTLAMGAIRSSPTLIKLLNTTFEGPILLALALIALAAGLRLVAGKKKKKGGKRRAASSRI